MLLQFFLFAPPPGQDGEGPGFLLGFLPIILMFVVLYFFMIRPQRKRQKERETLLDQLQKGDKVVTIGGAHGRVAGIDNEKKLVWVQLSDTVKIQFDKSAIASVERAGALQQSDTADKLSSTN